MTSQYQTRAIVLERPESVALTDLELTPMTPIDVLVDMEWSGISTGGKIIALALIEFVKRVLPQCKTFYFIFLIQMNLKFLQIY